MKLKKLICELFHRKYHIRTGKDGYCHTLVVYYFCWKCGRKWELKNGINQKPKKKRISQKMH